MNDERQDFSRRLAKALEAKGYPSRPGQLHKLFNSYYPGRSITFSTASKWLQGMAIPEQDKLQVLAQILAVEPHILRYGQRDKAGRVDGLLVGAGISEKQVIITYLALPSRCREAVGDLIKVVHDTLRQ